MERCNKKYGKYCFSCEKADYIIAAVGAGMDIEMMGDFGKLKPAISCPYKGSNLILDLSKDQLKEITRGRLEELTRENFEMLREVVSKKVKKYITKHLDEIKIKVLPECTVLPDYP